MDDQAPRRSLADDPNFVESLADLDRGLTGGREPDELFLQSRPASASPSPVAPLPPPAPVPGSPPLPRLSPKAAAAVSAAAAALAAAFDRPSADSAATTPPDAPAIPIAPVGAQAAGNDVVGPRPLLDLFPPAAAREVPSPPRYFAPAAPDHLRPLRGPAPVATEPPRIPALHRPSTPRPAPSGFTYESFYGLNANPFSPSPDLRFLYQSGSHDRVVQKLTTALGRRDGLVVLTGEPGIGKTILCQALVDLLGRHTPVSFVTKPLSAAGDLLRTVLVDFGVVSRDAMANGGLAEAAVDGLAERLAGFLASRPASETAALLIIDNAHELSVGVLSELQVLFAMATEQHLLQVVLVGEPGLTTLLRSMDLRPLDVLVAHRAELHALTPEEVAGYVPHRLAVAGGTGRIEFDDGALGRVYVLSQGVPRVVNLICDRALTIGYRTSAALIEDAIVKRAAQELALASEAGSSWRDRLVVAALMAALMLAGAAGAGWVFRAPLARVLAQWHGAPPASQPPVVR